MQTRCAGFPMAGPVFGARCSVLGIDPVPGPGSQVPSTRLRSRVDTESRIPGTEDRARRPTLHGVGRSQPGGRRVANRPGVREPTSVLRRPERTGRSEPARPVPGPGAPGRAGSTVGYRPSGGGWDLFHPGATGPLEGPAAAGMRRPGNPDVPTLSGHPTRVLDGVQASFPAVQVSAGFPMCPAGSREADGRPVRNGSGYVGLGPVAGTRPPPIPKSERGPAGGEAGTPGPGPEGPRGLEGQAARWSFRGYHSIQDPHSWGVPWPRERDGSALTEAR
jgi:hypothetical protein